jgi:hypothetical protein
MESAFWIAALNSFLNVKRPQDVQATDPELVIAAANDKRDESRETESCQLFLVARNNGFCLVQFSLTEW